MIDVTFTINNVDFSSKLSTYRVDYEYDNTNMVTAIDGTEHYGRPIVRPQIIFSLRPLTDDETAALFSAITGTNRVVFTDPPTGTVSTRYMRFIGNITSAFGLRSVDGNRYYKGEEMTLRSVSVA